MGNNHGECATRTPTIWHTMPADKLSTDVLCTRSHWYPKWLLFQAHRSERTLIKRVAVGQAICDAAIESGAAIPIPRNQQAICDTMHLIRMCFPNLVHHFLHLLVQEADGTRGWAPFLEAAAKSFARLCNTSDDPQKEDEALHLWSIWYRHHWHHQESSGQNSGYIFFAALDASEKCVRNLFQ